MRDAIQFNNREEFETFDRASPERGLEFGEVEFYIPIDLSIKAFMDLQWVEVSFEPYDQNSLFLKFSSKTNELFIGDMNDGGHVPRCRVMRIPRQDIYSNSDKLIYWTENRAYKLWLRKADAFNRK